MKTLSIIQFFRFAAALLVLFFHLNWIQSGYKGVDVFFVISGFVMYYSLFYKPRPQAVNFVINRLTKIFFLYWVALGILYFVEPFKFDSSFLSTLLLVPGHHSLLGVSWSLSYELYFYFLIGTVVYLIPGRYHKSIFILLFLCSTVITVLSSTSYSFKGSLVNFLLGGNFWEFLLGVLSAYLVVAYHRFMRPIASILIAVFSCMLFMTIAIDYAKPISILVYGVLSFLLVTFFSIFEMNKSVNDKLSKLFNVLGGASYAIYLFSPIVIFAISANDALSKVMVVLVTICFSILFNRFVENTFLLWVRKASTIDISEANSRRIL